MNTLDLHIYSDNNLVNEYTNIEYLDKLTFIYFKIDNTQYYLNKDLNTFKYQTTEEKVNMNFQEKKITITLLNMNYTLNINILKVAKEQNKNSYKISYILESEPEVLKTFTITLK